MNSISMNIGKNNQIKNLLIIIFVGLFALHSLYFLHSFAVNVPLGDEWDLVPFIEAFHNGENFINSPHFCKQHDEHNQCVPHLMILFSLITTDYNIIPLLFTGWILLLASTIMIYFILKHFDEKLTWLIIPFSAIIFNPIQYGNFLWQLANNGYFFTFIGYVGSVYFIHRINKNKLSIIPAIIFGIIATFSTLPGVLIWIVGIIGFYNFKKNKGLLLIWIIFGVIILSLFLADYSKFENEIIEINSEKINFFEALTILYSKGFVNNVPQMEFFGPIVGTIVFLLTTAGLFYLKLMKSKNLLPFIQFSFLGLLVAIAYYMGYYISGGVTGLDSTRYGTFFILPQITAFFVLIQIVRINFSSNIKIKQILIIIILLILFSGLTVSYYIGWWHGFHMNEEHMHVLNCLLEPNSDFLCLEHLYFPHIGSGANILRDLELGPFGNDVNYNDHSNDTFLKFLREQIVGIPFVVNYNFQDVKSNNLDSDVPQTYQIIDEISYTMNYNEPLHLIFDKTVYGEKIKIELSSKDVYSISFWKGDVWIDRLLIHTDESVKCWKNCSSDWIGSSNGPFTIAEREIPYLVQKNGFNKIVILPVKGDGEFNTNLLQLIDTTTKFRDLT